MIKDLVNFYLENADDDFAALFDLNEIANKIKTKGRDFGLYLLDEIYQESIKKGLCPECFKQLSIKTINEYRGEYQGTPCSEQINTYKCKSCGWEE